MKIDIKDFFKNSFVISISDKRLERFRKIINYLKMPQPQLFKGITDGRPIDNIRRTHDSLIYKAYQLKKPYLVIFEDDFYPCKNFNEIMQDHLNNIPDDADSINFGVSNILFYKDGRKVFFSYKFYTHERNNIGQQFKSNNFNGKYHKMNGVNGDVKGAGCYIIFGKAFSVFLNLPDKKPIDTLLNSLENYYIPDVPLSFQLNERGERVLHRVLDFDSFKYRIDPDEYFFKKIELE